MNKNPIIFKDRFDSKYIEYLLTLLELNGEHGLISTAVEIETPKTVNGRLFTKCIRIDFCGLSATTLLDRGKNFTNGQVAQAFLNVLNNLHLINELGIFVKIRFLFSYIYSDFAYSLIKAEKSRKRASIDEGKFQLSFQLENELSEENFYGSTTFANQQRSLEAIQIIAEKYHLFDNNALNTIQVRFSLISLNLCTLIVNNTALCDSYLYSKEITDSDRLCLKFPVVVLNQDSKFNFNAVVDNFRYHWNHSTTMYCKDATYFKNGDSQSLMKIRKPYNINFDSKAKRIFDLEKEHGKEETSELKIKQWKFLSKQSVLNSTKLFQEIPSTESIFIACSWRRRDDGSYLPNEYAILLQDYFKEDFATCIDVKLVEPEYGGAISEKIYANLKQSTLGIVLLTRDIEDKNGKFYARPNLYHELGFLMNQLDSPRTKRVLVLKKEGVEIASNTSNFEYISFEILKLEIKYGKILKWLKERCETIGYEQLKNATVNQLRRLDDLLKKGKIDHAAYNNLKKELDEL